MNTFIAWFKSKNITAHTIAAILVVVAGAITGDQQVRDFLITLFQKHPAVFADLSAIAGIYLKYSHSSSAAGTIATAQTIEASPNPPTAAAVDAAKVTKP